MTMLPRLQASESLLASTRVAVGSGSEHGPAIQREWQRAAGDADNPPSRPGTAASLDAMSSMGYAIKKVPMKPAAAPSEA